MIETAAAARRSHEMRLVCVAANASVDKVAAVERLVAGEIHRPDLLSAIPGGKAINVARAAHRLGLEVVVVPVVAGHAGAWLLEALAAEGLPARPVVIAGETRTCLSILDRADGSLTEFYEAGPRIEAVGWEALEAAVTNEVGQDPAATVVVISGSVPPGAPVDGYARIVRLVREGGGRTVVDADGQLLTQAVATSPWLVKVNEAEAASATGIPRGGERATIAAARALRSSGARAALVTRGLDGAIVLGEDGRAWRTGPPPERGAYPVGSGDSFLAGFLAGIADGCDAGEAARLGVAAATANALRPGQGDIGPEDVTRLRALVPLEILPPAESPAPDHPRPA